METAPGTYGNMDRTATAEIGRKLEMKVDNSDKQMKVYEDGKLTRTFPVSLGRKKMPSASGVMVVMEKKEQTVFDTREQFGPVEGYRVDVEFAQRLTWSGQFIHAAPGPTPPRAGRTSRTAASTSARRAASGCSARR